MARPLTPEEQELVDWANNSGAIRRHTEYRDLPRNLEARCLTHERRVRCSCSEVAARWPCIATYPLPCPAGFVPGNGLAGGRQAGGVGRHARACHRGVPSVPRARSRVGDQPHPRGEPQLRCVISRSRCSQVTSGGHPCRGADVFEMSGHRVVHCRSGAACIRI